MPAGPIERHLAAIVAADVVGYARLMGADEKGTLLALKTHRTELIDPLVAGHNGQIVKTIGDGLLLSFPSIVEAVSCAVAVQSGMAKRNASLPGDRRIELRVGVNIGDVIVEKGDVFGDGVNIAARLEQIAPPGGICLSEDAYRQVRGKLEIPIADTGEQQLKNIANPMRVYRIEPSVLAAADMPPPLQPRRRWSVRAMVGVAMAAAVLLAAGRWFALILGLVVFIGAHVFVTLRKPRAAVIAGIGEGPYKGLIALFSLAGLILIGYGFGQYRANGWIEVWHPPRWTNYVTQILMWPASIFVVAAYIRGNIWRRLKHPMLVGVQTWAVAHLIANGDLGSIVLFGSFLVWAGYDRATLKGRTDPGAPPIPAGGRRNDIIAIVVGTVLYLALGFIFHPLVVGVPVFGRPAF